MAVLLIGASLTAARTAWRRILVKGNSAMRDNGQLRYWAEGIPYRAADHPVTVAYAQPKCALIQRHLKLPGGATAVDVGTGNGTLFYSLNKLYPSVGVDFCLTCCEIVVLAASFVRIQQLPLASLSAGPGG